MSANKARENRRMEQDRILTPKGYAVRKALLTEAQVASMKEELTVTPKMNQKYTPKAVLDAATFKVYRESPTRWYLPRAWARAKFGEAETTTIPEGLPLPAAAAAFRGSPYPYQETIIEKFMSAGANGLVCVPCGKGKTFMALAIAARLGRRFLVVVDKEFLMNQWRGEMQALMPGLRVGILQGPKRQVEAESWDCCICMIQTVCGQELPDSIFRDFGFTIFDECHHLGAQHFSRTLTKIQTRWMLGLSATPNREDGLSKVFYWFLGEPVYMETVREPDPTVEVKAVSIETTDATYHDVPTDYRGEVVMARLLTNILGCADRTAEIVRWIRKLCAEPARRVLVLSERIGHLEAIEAGLQEGEGDAATAERITTAYYIGGMKEVVREEGAAKARVLLASYAMASEAMNIKSLNAVILASPRKSVEQSTGRILRTRVSERLVQPVIVDIIDDHSMYLGQWRKRLTYYKKCAYQIERWKHGAETASSIQRGKVPEAMEAPSGDSPQAGGCLLIDE